MTNQTPTEQQPISQDITDYIKLGDLFGFIISTYYNHYPDDFDKDESAYIVDVKDINERDLELLLGDLETPIDELNEDDGVKYKKVMSYLIRELETQLLNSGNPNIYTYEVEKGVRNRMIHGELLSNIPYAFQMLLDGYFKTCEKLETANEKNVPTLKKIKSLVALELFIGVLTSTYSYYIERSVAERVFYYPKKFRPNGYSEIKELQDEINRLKANQKADGGGEVERLKAELTARDEKIERLEKENKELQSKAKKGKAPSAHTRENNNLKIAIYGMYLVMEAYEIELRKACGHFEKNGINGLSLCNAIKDEFSNCGYDLKSPSDDVIRKRIEEGKELALNIGELEISTDDIHQAIKQAEEHCIPDK